MWNIPWRGGGGWFKDLWFMKMNVIQHDTMTSCRFHVCRRKRHHKHTFFEKETNGVNLTDKLTSNTFGIHEQYKEYKVRIHGWHRTNRNTQGIHSWYLEHWSNVNDSLWEYIEIPNGIHLPSNQIKIHQNTRNTPEYIHKEYTMYFRTIGIHRNHIYLDLRFCSDNVYKDWFQKRIYVQGLVSKRSRTLKKGFQRPFLDSRQGPSHCMFSDRITVCELRGSLNINPSIMWFTSYLGLLWQPVESIVYWITTAWCNWLSLALS